MERQHVQDKDAWRKNTIAQLKETRDRMQKLSENQLETLTKRTILENEAMAAELKYQSRQVSLQPQTTLSDALPTAMLMPMQTSEGKEGLVLCSLLGYAVALKRLCIGCWHSVPHETTEVVQVHTACATQQYLPSVPMHRQRCCVLQNGLFE